MPNLVYINEATPIWFVPATATQPENAAFEVHSTGAGAGHQSAQYDFGVAARSGWWAWRAFVQFATPPVVGETVSIYVKTSATDGHPDNDDGTVDGAVSAEDKLRNLLKIGQIVVDEAAQDIEMVASGLIFLPHRYLQVVFWVDGADGLTSDVNENGFSLTPVPDEIQ